MKDHNGVINAVNSRTSWLYKSGSEQEASAARVRHMLLALTLSRDHFGCNYLREL